MTSKSLATPTLLTLQIPLEVHRIKLLADPEAMWVIGFVAGEPAARAARKPASLLQTILVREVAGRAVHYTGRYIASAALVPPHRDAAIMQALELEQALWSKKRGTQWRAPVTYWWEGLPAEDIIAHRMVSIKPSAAPLTMRLQYGSGDVASAGTTSRPVAPIMLGEHNNNNGSGSADTLDDDRASDSRDARRDARREREAGLGDS